jgi:hypothetical protein
LAHAYGLRGFHGVDSFCAGGALPNTVADNGWNTRHFGASLLTASSR